MQHSTQYVTPTAVVLLWLLVLRNLGTIADKNEWLYYLPCGTIAASSSECAEGQKVVPGCACAELLPFIQIHVPTRLHQRSLQHRRPQSQPWAVSRACAQSCGSARCQYCLAPERTRIHVASQHTATLTMQRACISSMVPLPHITSSHLTWRAAVLNGFDEALGAPPVAQGTFRCSALLR